MKASALASVSYVSPWKAEEKEGLHEQTVPLRVLNGPVVLLYCAAFPNIVQDCLTARLGAKRDLLG